MEERSGQAFVAGATGLTGRAVVQQLRAMSIPTVAHVRPDSSRLGEWRQRFTAIGASVDTTPWVAKAMQDTLRHVRPSHVFALLGTTKKRTRGDGQDYMAIDYGLTAQLIDGCDEPLRFVYLSSMGVKEGASGAYLQARWKAESKLRDSGLPYTIARPSFIIGNRDEARPLEKMTASVADGLLSVVKAFGGKKVAARYQSMSPDQLGRALIAAARQPELLNQIVEADVLRTL